MTAVLEVRDLSYRLPGAGDRHLVTALSFSVAPGETLVLLGRSGSGKTTTLKLINRLLEPTSGEVRLQGEATATLEPYRLRRRIGYVIQEIGLFPHFTVAQNVGLVPRLEGWPPDRIAGRVRELLALVGLDPDDSPSAPRARSPAASANGWAWRAPSLLTRRCCCSTSRSARSIPSPASSCSANSARSREGLVRGWCS